MTTITNFQVNARALVYLAPIAGLIAATINVILLLIGSSSATIQPDVITPVAGQPLTAMRVIIASVVPALAAGILLAGLSRFTKNPLRIFNIILVVLFVLSFALPLGLPGMPIGMTIYLDLMHIVLIGVVMYVYNRFAKYRTVWNRADKTLFL